MKIVFAAIAAASILWVASAQAYNIKHSYSGPGNATEYYGLCSNGAQLKVVERPDGNYAYAGPAGEGTVKGGNLDAAAKAACGE